jgi:hypothetical protein
MKKICGLICFVAAFQFASISGLVFAGTVIHQPQLGYSLTMPDGWEQIPTKAIEEQMQAAAAATGTQMSQRYDDGFQRANGGDYFQHPYIMVQVKENGRMPEQQLTKMKSVRAGLQTGLDSASKKLAPVISNMTLGESYYDADNECVLIRMSMNLEIIGEVKALTCCFLTERGMLLFHCYSKAAEFDTQLLVFQDLLKSVKISDDLKYKPRLGDSIGLDFGRIGRSTLIGGVIGGLFGVVFWLKKKIQNKQPQSTEPPPLP